MDLVHGLHHGCRRILGAFITHDTGKPLLKILAVLPRIRDRQSHRPGWLLVIELRYVVVTASRILVYHILYAL
jgi:hypothetical protein